jgi:hypothetical protein
MASAKKIETPISLCWCYIIYLYMCLHIYIYMYIYIHIYIHIYIYIYIYMTYTYIIYIYTRILLCIWVFIFSISFSSWETLKNKQFHCAAKFKGRHFRMDLDLFWLWKKTSSFVGTSTHIKIADIAGCSFPPQKSPWQGSFSPASQEEWAGPPVLAGFRWVFGCETRDIVDGCETLHLKRMVETS